MGREIAELKNSKLPEHRQKGILRERSGRKNPFEDRGDGEGDCGTKKQQAPGTSPEGNFAGAKRTENPFEGEGDGEGDCGTNIRRNKMGTLVVLVVLAGIVAAVLRTMIRDKKAGKSLQCGGNCTACKGHCQAQAAQKEK